ncbi:MAG: glycoside hydrolase family 127 protein [Candidatus Aminicenantaceae bacterium]
MEIKISTRSSLILLGFLIMAIAACTEEADAPDYPITPVGFTEVALSDGFWAPRLETNRVSTIPFAMQQNEETGRVDNFRIAGGLMEGKYKGERYNDTDVYKVMEGAAYTLALEPDPKLDSELDSLIEIIAAAQEEDGYLFTSRTADPDNPLMGTGEERWSNLAVSHELYNAGHLYEAAVAHYLATGKRSFLEVALQNAELVAATFGPDLKRDAPGHQEIELGLVKLFRVTKDSRYLELAKYFLDQRGHGLELKIYPEGHRFSIYNDPVQIQAHKPVIEQEEAVGHAVRCMYMYAGMADVAAMAADTSYIAAMDRLWENVVGRKMALTGGVGARHARENFGDDYELPNLTSYNETCAAIGMVLWNHRMFLLHGDARYLDVMERVLYNGVIAGVSLEGDTFFYPNPLESDGKYRFNKGKAARQPWFGTACCPGNIARFLPAVPGYVYARNDDTLYVNLFVTSGTTLRVAGQKVGLKQETLYPWEGKIKITLEPARTAEFTVNVRVPGWARSRPVPSDLYRYLDSVSSNMRIQVNGEAQDLELIKGFASFHRTWNKGDVIELDLPMPVRRVLSHESVEDNRGKVALERGPLVYCVEWPDNEVDVLSLALPDSSNLATEYREELLQGLMVITGDAYSQAADSPEPAGAFSTQFAAIPYYAWAHRGIGEMAVWMKRK